MDKFQIIANCCGGSNVLHMLILHPKCSINVPTSCVWPGTCRNIWNVPNLLLAGKWQVLSTRACNVLKMFLLISRPPRPQCKSRTHHDWQRSKWGWVHWMQRWGFCATSCRSDAIHRYPILHKPLSLPDHDQGAGTCRQWCQWDCWGTPIWCPFDAVPNPWKQQGQWQCG